MLSGHWRALARFIVEFALWAKIEISDSLPFILITISVKKNINHKVTPFRRVYIFCVHTIAQRNGRMTRNVVRFGASMPFLFSLSLSFSLQRNDNLKWAQKTPLFFQHRKKITLTSLLCYLNFYLTTSFPLPYFVFFFIQNCGGGTQENVFFWSV